MSLGKALWGSCSVSQKARTGQTKTRKLHATSQVRQEGDAALAKLAKRFDGAELSKEHGMVFSIGRGIQRSRFAGTNYQVGTLVLSI